VADGFSDCCDVCLGAKGGSGGCHSNVVESLQKEMAKSSI